MKHGSDEDEGLLVAGGRRRKDKGKAPVAEAEIVYDEPKVRLKCPLFCHRAVTFQGKGGPRLGTRACSVRAPA